MTCYLTLMFLPIYFSIVLFYEYSVVWHSQAQSLAFLFPQLQNIGIVKKLSRICMKTFYRKKKSCQTPLKLVFIFKRNIKLAKFGN